MWRVICYLKLSECHAVRSKHLRGGLGGILRFFPAWFNVDQQHLSFLPNDLDDHLSFWGIKVFRSFKANSVDHLV